MLWGSQFQSEDQDRYSIQRIIYWNLKVNNLYKCVCLWLRNLSVYWFEILMKVMYLLYLWIWELRNVVQYPTNCLVYWGDYVSLTKEGRPFFYRVYLDSPISCLLSFWNKISCLPTQLSAFWAHSWKVKKFLWSTTRKRLRIVQQAFVDFSY
jgi:hypothetical protein